MVAEVKVQTSFRNKTDWYMDSEVRDQVESIVDNTQFSTVVKTLALAAQVCHGNYVPALYAARSGDRESIAVKNGFKLDLAIAMKKVAVQVNVEGAGDLAKLLSTKIPLAKQPEARILTKPTGIKATNGDNSGDMIVKVGEVENADFFVFQWTIDPITESSVWTSKYSKKRSCKFTGFTAGTVVWFRVQAVGSNDQEILSDVISCYVL